MSWFGFGGSGKKEEPSTSSYDDSFPNDPSSSFTNDFSSPSAASSVSSQGGLPSGFEERMIREQQQLIAQQLVSKLTDIAFDQCISKPSSSLSSSEQSCIASIVTKYIEGSQLIINRVSNIK